MEVAQRFGLVLVRHAEVLLLLLLRGAIVAASTCCCCCCCCWALASDTSLATSRSVLACTEIGEALLLPLLSECGLFAAPFGAADSAALAASTLPDTAARADCRPIDFIKKKKKKKEEEAW